MKASILLLIAVAGVAATRAHAVVILDDCTNDPHLVANAGTDTTHLDVGAEDLVIRCALEPLPQTSRVVVRARDVTVEGPAGSVTGTGKTKAVDIRATGTFTALDTVIQSTNGNANMDIIAVGDMVIRDSQVIVGELDRGGDLLKIECTGPGCTIDTQDSLFKGRLMEVLAVGDIFSFNNTTFRTHGPRDFITIRSTAGNVLLPCGVIVRTGNEGDLVIESFGRIDLWGADIRVAEHIVITSGVGPGLAAVPAADVNATSATIRNDFGKDGQIVVTADEAQQIIDITDATIIQEGPEVAELNGRRALPHTGFNNVVGVPAVDE
jgi:hypothetical protein